MTEPAAALVFAEPSGIVRMWNSAAESLFGTMESVARLVDALLQSGASR